MVASWCRWAASLAALHRVSGAGRRFSTCNRILHARPLEAVARYYEMAFLIRRRRHDEPSAERVRLTERFADVQAELASRDALMRADPDSAVRKAYASLARCRGPEPKVRGSNPLGRATKACKSRLVAF